MDAKQVLAALWDYCNRYRLLGIQEASAGSWRFDFWWMTPSINNQVPCGVEIKVSRADFKADKKWRNYLPFCEKFYFACPAGLIQESELEPGIGLIWVTPEGTAYFQRRAKRRPMTTENLHKMLLRVIFKLHFVPKERPDESKS